MATASESDRFTIRPAVVDDVDDLVQLGARLFEEDADVYDSHIDLTWSSRYGREDITGLLNSESSLVLMAGQGPEPVGHLVAYTTNASATRQPVSFAVLRSLYVVDHVRRTGVGRQLVAEFVDWARSSGCVEARVSSYVDNTAAQSFYRSLGFDGRSIERVLEL